METVTLKMEPKQIALLQERAKALGRSQAAIVRELIDEHLGRVKRPSLYERSKDLCGSVRGSRNLSARPLKGYGPRLKSFWTPGLSSDSLSATDQHHEWAVEAWKSLSEPFATCEAVASEAVFLLQSDGIPVEPLLQLFQRGLVKIEFDVNSQWPDVGELLRKYSRQPMSLADACLVRMAELNFNCQILTTDRDFLIYRRKGRKIIPLLAPF